MRNHPKMEGKKLPDTGKSEMATRGNHGMSNHIPYRKIFGKARIVTHTDLYAISSRVTINPLKFLKSRKSKKN